jgi:hypothetical protein
MPRQCSLSGRWVGLIHNCGPTSAHSPRKLRSPWHAVNKLLKFMRFTSGHLLSEEAKAIAPA